MQERGKLAAGLKVGALVIQHKDVNIHELLYKGRKSGVYVARHIKEWGEAGNWPEHYEQTALVNVMRTNKIVFHSIPNGGARDIKVAGTLKREGLMAGVPDLYVIDKPKEQPKLPGRPLAIEMKRRNGSFSDVAAEQWQWLLHLAKQDWLVVVAFGFSAAEQFLDVAGYKNSASKEDLFFEAIKNG